VESEECHRKCSATIFFSASIDFDISRLQFESKECCLNEQEWFLRNTENLFNLTEKFFG
jgi:hypothetical protein